MIPDGDNRFRILIVAEDLFPGGATVVLGRIISLWKKWGHDVVCISGDPSPGPFAEHDIRYDADAAKGGWGMKGRLVEVPRARRLLKRYAPDVVVINATSPGYMYAFMLHRLPVICHLHTVINAGNRLLRRLVYPRSRGNNKRLVTVSRWHRANVRDEWGLREERIALLPNYPDRMVTMREQRDVVLTAGRFHWSKSPRTWKAVGMRMQELLSKSSMTMVWCAPDLDGEAREISADLPSVMRIVRIEDQAQLDAYFARTAVCYQPSVVEAQGIAVLEAMQNGIPAVVTEGTGMADAVRDGENGLIVRKDDAEAHEAALAALITDEGRRERLGAQARETIQQTYSAAKWEREYREIVRAVI